MNIDFNYKVAPLQPETAPPHTTEGMVKPAVHPIAHQVDGMAHSKNKTIRATPNNHDSEPYKAKLSLTTTHANKALNPAWYGAGVGERGRELIIDTLQTARDFTFLTTNAWLANLPSQIANSPYASEQLRSVKQSSDELVGNMRHQAYEFVMNPIGISLDYVNNQVERGKALYAQLAQNRFTDASSKAFGHELTDWLISLPVLGSVIKRTGPKLENPPKTRIDLTEKINPVPPQGTLIHGPNHNGIKIYSYKPVANHNLRATVRDGYLSITIYAHNDKNLYGGGRDMIVGLMNRLKRDQVEIRGINEIWSSGYSNFYTQYHENIKKGLPKEQAAANTWSGRIWSEFGFTHFRVDDSKPYLLRVYMDKPS